MRSLIACLGALVVAAAACSAGTETRAAARPDAGPTVAGAAPTVLAGEHVRPERGPSEARGGAIRDAQGRPIPELTLRDFSFSPRSLSATAGRTFNLRVVNDGTVTHNFAIVVAGTTLMSVDVEPGDFATVGFLPPAKPGRYGFACRFHRDGGMTGTLIVR